MPSLAQLQAMADALQADPAKNGQHAARLLEALQGDNEVGRRSTIRAAWGRGEGAAPAPPGAAAAAAAAHRLPRAAPRPTRAHARPSRPPRASRCRR
jgi:hypothetical protein